MSTAPALSPGESWPVLAVLHEVFGERKNQLAKWGEQSHPDGTDAEFYAPHAISYQQMCDQAAARGQLTWLDILLEEVTEAAAEEEWPELRAELIQVAAVATAWVQDGDSRAKAASAEGD